MSNGSSSIPCVELPKIPEIPNIELLGGAEIRSFVDFAQGMPTDCKLTFNLLVQLGPLLASMACLLKILNVIGKLQDFVEAAKPPFTSLPDTIPGLVGAIEELKGCIPAFAIPQILLMIKGILQLVINFLSCFIELLENLVTFKAELDFNAAAGNPVLIEALTCADENAQTTMENLMLSLQSIEPVLNTVTAVGDIAGVSLELPDFSTLSLDTGPSEVVSGMKESISSLRGVVDSLPV